MKRNVLELIFTLAVLGKMTYVWSFCKRRKALFKRSIHFATLKTGLFKFIPFQMSSEQNEYFINPKTRCCLCQNITGNIKHSNKKSSLKNIYNVI